jgi:hypothetical protein
MMQRVLAAVPRTARVISKRRDFSALVSLEEEFPGYVVRWERSACSGDFVGTDPLINWSGKLLLYLASSVITQRP